MNLKLAAYYAALSKLDYRPTVCIGGAYGPHATNTGELTHIKRNALLDYRRACGLGVAYGRLLAVASLVATLAANTRS